MSTVYGPVPSWRFGRSLGVDVLLPPKTCTFNCVYCQLGGTSKLLSAPSSSAGVKVERVKTDLEQQIKRMDLNSIDVVTVSGSGEPTINLQLGEIVKCIKSFLPDKPVVLLTNSSLLYSEKVRENISKFDVVSAKLDAGDNKTFNLINRPTKGIQGIMEIAKNIKKLKSEMEGKLMIQSMFLRTTFNLTNCEGEKLRELIDLTVNINPDVIQIDTPYRPGGEKFVLPVPIDELKSIAEEFKEFFPADKLWVLGLHDLRGRKVKWKRKGSVGSEIIELVKRRPCRIIDLADSLGISYIETEKIVKELLEKNQLKEKSKNHEKYYVTT